MSLNASKIAAFCATQYGQPLCPLHGAVNIVYIEGINPDGTPNDDRYNEWNDLRLLLTQVDGVWQIIHNAVATTEPGDYYTKRPPNKGGCARIAFGYHPPAWAHGLHKGTQPALVQRKGVTIHRDLNRDGLRNRSEPPFWAEGIGINQHTTSKRFNGSLIGRYSAGCLVGKNYAQHLNFLELIKQDTRIVPGVPYLYDSWVLPGDSFNKFNFEI